MTRVRIVLSVYLLALAAWTGSVLFQSFVVMPTLFTNLAPTRAGEIATLLFPGYYAFGLACGVLLLAACAYLAWSGHGRGWLVATATVAVMLGCQAFAAGVVRPQMAELRGAGERGVAFDRLHRLSVRLNGVVLLGGVGLVLASARLLERRAAG